MKGSPAALPRIRLAAALAPGTCSLAQRETATSGDSSRAIRPLEHADAVRRDQADQAAKQRLAVRPRQPLQHVIADDEIERARRGEELGSV